MEAVAKPSSGTAIPVIFHRLRPVMMGKSPPEQDFYG
jgi:hypothetical protein